MRRQPPLLLLALVCGVELVDLSLITAISPLLPRYAERFDFGASTSGQVVAAFAIGNLLAALPAAMLCGRFGGKPIVVAGCVLTAAGSVWLGLAGSTAELMAARIAQGTASATAWQAAIAWLAAATPPERRGRVLGISGAFAVAGTLAGPGLGALAAGAGITRVFVGVAAFSLVLASTALVLRGRPASRQTVRHLLAAARQPQLVLGFALILVAGSALAAQNAIAPLHLAELGLGATGIGAVYMVAGGIEAGVNPLLGRWLDLGRSRRGPVGGAIVAASVVSALLAVPWLDRTWPYAVLIAAMTVCFGLFFLPGLTSLAEGSDAAGLDHAYGFALTSLSWAPGQAIGSLVGGAIAETVGDEAAYLVIAAVAAAMLVVLPRLAARVPAR